MKIKTSELTGAALNWAVAKCEGVLSPVGNVIVKGRADRSHKLIIMVGEIEDPIVEYSPSTDWAQGGRLIERENICLNWAPRLKEMEWEGYTAAPEQLSGEVVCYGPTPLIAAMRCLIASKLGDEVDVPEELLCTP